MITLLCYLYHTGKKYLVLQKTNICIGFYVDLVPASGTCYKYFKSIIDILKIYSKTRFLLGKDKQMLKNIYLP